MTEALDILDELGAPGEIGSTLDLAASRLEKFLDRDDQAAAGVQLLITQLKREFQIAPTRNERKHSPGTFLRFASVPNRHRRRYHQSC